MDSKVAKRSELASIESTQRLSPEQRVNAFLEHCRLITELYEAGEQIRNADCKDRDNGRAGESALLMLDAANLLVDHKIDYAIIGALAASVHGAVRASMDVEVLLAAEVPKLKSLEAAFRTEGFHTVMRDREDPVLGSLLLRDSFGNQVDLLLGLRGIEEHVFLRAIEVPFQGTDVRVIGREDFIAMNVFRGSPLDLVDASRAIWAGRDSLDFELMRRLAKRFGGEALVRLERLLSG